jgi:hypothetical protein
MHKKMLMVVMLNSLSLLGMNERQDVARQLARDVSCMRQQRTENGRPVSCEVAVKAIFEELPFYRTLSVGAKEILIRQAQKADIKKSLAARGYFCSEIEYDSNEQVILNNVQAAFQRDLQEGRTGSHKKSKNKF